VRRLKLPTLTQWGCKHRWKTTTTRPGQNEIVRVRYLSCQRCGLKVKTEERLAVPWDERDFMALITQTFPEGTMADVATLQTQGLLDGGLSQLNAYLVPHGWQLDLVRDRGQGISIVRRRIAPDVRGGTNSGLNEGR
jgi:hypothetical protein